MPPRLVSITGILPESRISINVNPDLKSYDGIIACGLENYSTTSLHQIGIKIEMKDFDQKLIQTAKKFF